MDLTLFVIFLSLSVILIAIGLIKAEHTELALVGFLFLFLLSMLILTSDIQYKTGSITNTTYTYNNGTLNFTQEIAVDTYSTFTGNNALSWIGSTIAHLFGYWLAIVSVVGFIGVLLSLRGNKRYV